MSKPDIDLVRIGEVLNKHCVDYVVVGGIAVILQGGETATVDIDLAFDSSTDNIDRLADALAELNAKPKRWAGTNFRLQRSDLSSKWLHLGSEFGDINLIAETPGVRYETISRNCNVYTVGSAQLRVAALQDLIEMKRNTGRSKDESHVSELEALQKLKGD